MNTNINFKTIIRVTMVYKIIQHLLIIQNTALNITVV